MRINITDCLIGTAIPKASLFSSKINADLYVCSLIELAVMATGSK
jgi:hypothetical protein